MRTGQGERIVRRQRVMVDDPASRGQMPEEIVAADGTDGGDGDEEQERDGREPSRHCGEYTAYSFAGLPVSTLMSPLTVVMRSE